MEWMKLLKRAIDYIEENITEDIGAEDIAKEINVSASYFQRAFRILSGFTLANERYKMLLEPSHRKSLKQKETFLVRVSFYNTYFSLIGNQMPDS